MTRRVAEHRIDDLGGQEARDHDLLEQAPHDQPARARHVDPSRVAADVQLRDQLVRSHDRAGHQVREERQVQENVEPP